MEAVIVTYNSAAPLAHMLACRPLLAAFERIVIVDNGSSDATLDLARAKASHLIELDKNVGFAGAANIGVAATSGPIFALLNPDIAFSSSSAPARLAEHFADSRVAVVGPQLLLPDGSTQDSARAVPGPLDLLVRRVIDPTRGAVVTTVPQEVPWVVGAFIVVRRAAFEAVGGFDARYRLYFEDVDLCVRLRAAEWKVMYEPGVTAMHDHAAASRKAFPGWAARQHLRSALRFYRKYPDFIVGR